MSRHAVLVTNSNIYFALCNHWPLCRRRLQQQYTRLAIIKHTFDSASIMSPGTYASFDHEKSPVHAAASENQIRRPIPSFRQRLIGRIVPVVLLTAALLLLVRLTFSCHGGPLPTKPFGKSSRLIQDVMNTEKVALEAHIMSKCPDARDCLQQLVVPTMEQVSDKVNFTISYIGR